jgi:hypothetical protein
MQKAFDDDYVYFTLDVVIRCPPERLYRFVKDPRNLERWTKVFRKVEHHEGGVYRFVHEFLGFGNDLEGYFTIAADDRLRTIDYFWGDRPGEWWGFASSRVIAFGGKSVYVFTIFRYKDKAPEPYLRTGTQVIEDELAILKDLMEACASNAGG